MRNHSIDYPQVEAAIAVVVTQNQKPTTTRVKEQLKVPSDSFDEIIEYYIYMWEQRHTATYLDTISPLKSTELQTKDFAKRTMQLEESLAMMRATIEATVDALIMINKEGKMVGYNQKLIDLVGLPESVRSDEIKALNYLFEQIVDPQELANLVRKKYQDPIPGSCGEMFFKDGKIVERYYQPQVINDRVVGHVWSLRDITEKRKQEESLRLTNRAMHASTHGIIVVENNPPEYTITYLNPASQQLLKVSEEDVLQKSIFIITSDFKTNQEVISDIFKHDQKGQVILECTINNRILWLEVNIDPVYEKDQETISHFVNIINDITKNKELENILQYKAVHDALTGLPNKTYLEDAIRYRTKKAMTKNENFGLLFIDIDRFKNINDTLGHGIGDKLLCMFSKRLQNCIQKHDVIARIGGDEFIILVNNASDADTLHAITKRLMEACRRKFNYTDHEFNITVSIGMVLFPGCGNDPGTLIQNADIAMYQAKSAGRNRACFYTKTLNHTMSRRVEIENQLHDAIKNNEFELAYQPIYNLESKCFKKAESLIRWHNKKLGNISPAEFIPIAEDIGMMTTIGRWVIENTIHQSKQWENEGLKDLAISINVSAKQLLDENFVDHINQTIFQCDIMSKRIILEITESLFLIEGKVSEKLNALNNLGIKIAIDDFGTGYSNLNYLNKLHVTYLKIDKSFVDQIDQNHFNDSVILAIIAISKRMKFKVIAEGVETKNQLDFLEKNECDEIQGYYFSEPLNAKDFMSFMKK